MHNYLISDSTLETVAKHIGLGDIMLCSVGLSFIRLPLLFIVFLTI